MNTLASQGWQEDDTFGKSEDKPKGKPRGKSKADDIDIDDILDGD